MEHVTSTVHKRLHDSYQIKTILLHLIIIKNKKEKEKLKTIFFHDPEKTTAFSTLSKDHQSQTISLTEISII